MIAKRSVQALGEPARHLRRAHVRRDDDQVPQLLPAIVRHEHRRGVQVIDGNVEEPLQLVLVKVDPQHAVRARGHDHVRHQLRADRDAWLVLPVLPRVAVVRHHARDARRRRAPRRIDQEQQLHDVFGRRIGRLDDEDVVAADVLVDADEDLAVGEPSDGDLRQIRPETPANFLGEPPIGGTREELEPAARD